MSQVIFDHAYIMGFWCCPQPALHPAALLGAACGLMQSAAFIICAWSLPDKYWKKGLALLVVWD